jgi:uncharacterized membrane protein
MMTPPVSRREVVALTGIVALGATLRWGQATAGGFWLDEAQAMDIVALSTIRSTLDFLVHHESHPPLYYLLMRWWTSWFSASDVSVLTPGFGLGLLSIVLAWWFARTIASRRAGLVAAVLVALSSSAILTDPTARPYGLLRVVLLLTMIQLWHALERGRGRALLGWVAGSVVLLYTHNLTVLPVVGMGATALWIVHRGESKLSLRALYAAGAGIVLCWLPWLPRLLYQAQHAGHMSPPESLLERAVVTTVFVLPGLDRLASLALWGGVAGVLILDRQRRKAPFNHATVLIGGTAVITMVLAVAGSSVSNMLVPHALTMLSPLILVPVAAILTAPRAYGRKLAGVALGLAVVFAATGGVKTAREPRSSTALMAGVVSGAAAQGDLVLVMPSPLISSFHRYYRGPATVHAYPRGPARIPAFFDDRIRRDTDTTIIRNTTLLAVQVLEHGGSVWQFATDIPPIFRPPSLELERVMTEVAGPPSQFGGVRTRASIEEITLRVWRRRATPAKEVVRP